MEKNILKTCIIDDDPFFGNLSKNYLIKKLKVEVDVYYSAEDYLSRMHLKNYDVIFLDYNLSSKKMFAMNGLEALYNIKLEKPNQKIIFMSTDENLEYLIESMSIGAEGYVFKNSNTPNSILYYIKNTFNTY